jgi:hypothetical protein
MPRRPINLAILLALVALVLVASGCGDKTKTVTSTGANGQATTQTVPDVHFAKTKFLLHSGLAFGAFHRYIYKPYRAGSLKKGASGRTKAMVKAGAAGLFAAHELKQARRAALSDDRLRPLATRIDALIRRLGPLASRLKGGVLDPTGLVGAAGAFDALGKASSAAGASVKDRVPPGNLGG